MNPSLVGSQMSREATSEQSSICEGASYNEVFHSGQEPKKGFSWSSKRETSVQSPDKEVESYRGEGEEEVIGEEEGEVKERGSDGDEDDGDEESFEETLGSLGDNHPFLLPKIWTVNDFLPTTSAKVFKTLRDRYQISDNIPIRLPRKFKRCYSGRTTDVGMYDAMFAAGVRLPLTALCR